MTNPNARDNLEFLEPVAARIGDAIKEFFASHKVGDEFLADHLRNFVAWKAGRLAPASADRVMRDLRQRGEINYVVASRAGSRYMIVPTEAKAA